MRSLVLASLVSVGAVGCGPDSIAAFTDEGAADELAIAEGELTTDEVAAVLRYVNGPEGTYLSMTAVAGISAWAANPILWHVSGPDTVRGTADDDPCDTLAELDGLPYVGAATLTRLAAFAVPHYGPGAVMVKDLSFSVAEQEATVLAANTVDLATTSAIPPATWAEMLARRPFSTFAQVTAVRSLTADDLFRIRAYAAAHPAHPPVGPAGPCNGTGGTYDSVAFTQAEECKGVEFLNKARVSEMGALPAAARDLAYRSNPEGLWGFRTSRWTNLKTFSLRPNIGVTAMRAIKTSSAGWSPNGLPYDTVANTYANRVALNGKPVFLDKVYVTRVFARAQDGAWSWECGELRDSPTATRYLRGCYQYIGADSSSGCAASGDCWVGMAGKWVGVEGFVRPSSLPGTGGWKLALSSRGAWAPNPNIP